jgi:hypothetical protein
MSEPDALSFAARCAAFATLGTLSTTQVLVHTILGAVEGAEPELVAEETLCLTATATARAAEVGLREKPEVRQAVVPVLLDLPFAYRDYLVGGALLEGASALVDAGEAAYGRLERKRAFYTVHLPAGQFPAERLLTDKMGLWMGRVSPPRLPETPTERLGRLDAVATLLAHLKLVLAFGRQAAG